MIAPDSIGGVAGGSSHDATLPVDFRSWSRRHTKLAGAKPQRAGKLISPEQDLKGPQLPSPGACV
jgi:hypothetical protein